jgi:hypothetical protein
MMIKPEWRTSTVVSLCESMRECQDYSALPILADALQDAGCDDDSTLSALRATLPHWKGERVAAIIYSNASAAAVAWVDAYADSLGPEGYPSNNWDSDGDDPTMTYQRLMESAHEYAKTGESPFNSMNYSNASCDPEYNEFWRNFTTITGVTVSETDSFFQCVC